MAWVNKVKQLLRGFLSTHDSKYIITHDGKKIMVINSGFVNKLKSITGF